MKNKMDSILKERYIGEERIYKLKSLLKLSFDSIFYGGTSRALSISSLLPKSVQRSVQIHWSGRVQFLPVTSFAVSLASFCSGSITYFKRDRTFSGHSRSLRVILFGYPLGVD